MNNVFGQDRGSDQLVGKIVSWVPHETVLNILLTITGE